MWWISFIVLFLAIPAGYLIAWLARDELADGRMWFRALVGLTIVSGGVLLFFHKPASLALFFIAILSLIALIKSHDKKWIGKKKA